MQVSFIHLLSGSPFHLCLHIIYTCHSFAYHQFSFWYNWSLWCYFVMLLREFQFFSWGSFFLVVSRSFRYYTYCYYLTTCKFFQTSDCYWSFTGVCVTASLLGSPGLFSVFWAITAMLWSGCSQFFFSKHFATVPSAPTTIVIVVIFVLHSFFNSLARFKYYYYVRTLRFPI